MRNFGFLLQVQAFNVSKDEFLKTKLMNGIRLTLAPLGGGGPKAPPVVFSQIAPEVLGISL